LNLFNAPACLSARHCKGVNNLFEEVALARRADSFRSGVLKTFDKAVFDLVDGLLHDIDRLPNVVDSSIESALSEQDRGYQQERTAELKHHCLIVPIKESSGCYGGGSQDA